MLFLSCQSYKSQIDIGYILKNCQTLKGKELVLKATYMGWHCPKNCKHPGITRSDTCWVDNSGCIYAKGLSMLDPFRDKGKKFMVEARVEETPKEVCYLKVYKVKHLNFSP